MLRLTFQESQLASSMAQDAPLATPRWPMAVQHVGPRSRLRAGVSGSQGLRRATCSAAP